MNKDDILEKSRKENKYKDLYAQEVISAASITGAFVSLFSATIFFVIEKVVKDEFNFALYAVMVSFGAAQFIVKAALIKRRRDMMFAIIYTLAALILIGLYIYQLTASLNV